MAKMPDEWYRTEAIRLYQKAQTNPDNMTGEVVDVDPISRVFHETGDSKPALHVDKESCVSKGTAPGAWVMAWCWVPDPPGEQVD